MAAFLSSLKTHGHQICENSYTADAAVIWSVLWAGRMRNNQKVWQHYRSQGKPVFVLDVGALYRGLTWKIALNSITAEGHYGHQQNLDWNRPRKLGISLAVNVNKNPRIVIAAQHHKSLQVEKLDSIEHWIMCQIQILRQVTDRPLVIRPHPRSALSRSFLHELSNDIMIEQPQQVLDTYDSYNLAFDCHAMVNYNSGPGIQAALAGTRPLVDQSSLAWPVSIGLADLDKPYTIDRDQWLVEICHTEYQLDEIRAGAWVPRLEQYLVQAS